MNKGETSDPFGTSIASLPTYGNTKSIHTSGTLKNSPGKSNKKLSALNDVKSPAAIMQETSMSMDSCENEYQY